MNFLKKGPQLKLSGLKVPGFLQDIYFDLKDRHLLPVAAVLLVAIFAVPIAIGQSGSEGAESDQTTAPSATPSGAGSGSAQLVAKSSPGLRDYHRRLKRLRAKDPFVQQYSGEEASAAANTESSSPGPATESSESGFATSESSSQPSPPTSPSAETETSGQPSPGSLDYYSYAIDVRVSTGGSQASGSSASSDQPAVRRNLPELTMLPSRKTPALIYMGSTKDGKKALMLVSSDVDAVFGDARCVLGSEKCELLAMKPGLPETVIFGGAEKTYKIELRKIHLVRTKDLNRASLGEPKHSANEPHPHPHGGGNTSG